MDDSMIKQSVKKKRKSNLIVRCLIVALIFGVTYKLFRGGEMMQEKARMEQYLKERYGKEFIVENIGNYYKYFGAPKEIKGIAYPKDNKELKFDIMKFADGTEYLNGQIYEEGYLETLWKKQLEDVVRYTFNSKVITISILAPWVEIENKLNGKTINLEEAIRMYKNKICIYISCGIFISSETQNMSPRMAEDIYPLIKRFNNENLEENKIEIRWFNEKYKNDVENNSKKYLYAEASDYRELKGKNIVIFKMVIDDIRKVNKPEDIMGYVKK